jgi:hypothetical protein
MLVRLAMGGIMTHRCARNLVPGALALAIFAAVPAAAQEQSSDGWQYAETAETCRAYRSYGEGENAIVLQLRTFGPGSAVETTVASAQVPREPSSVRMVELGWDGQGFDDHQVGVLGTLGGVPSVTLLTAHRRVAAFAFFFSETAVTVSPLDPAAQSMQLRVVGNAPRDLQMGSLAEPLSRLAECDERLMEQWGWGRDYALRVTTAPEMRNPQLWFEKAIIYPAVQNLNRVSSILQLRLKVDTEGRVAECVVQSSPGSSLFGSKNCTGLRRSARFNPARDVEGQPVDSYLQMSITFARFD